MSSDPAASPGEFRRHRRFVSWFILSFVSLGSVWLLASVGVTIYRRRHAVPAGALVGTIASASDLQDCQDELTDVEQGLERHIENAPHVVAHYEPEDVQRWDEDQSFWLGQWKAADERCRFSVHRPGKLSKEWEQLSTIHAELQEAEASYTKELKRFGKTEAPRLDRIRDRLNRVGDKLSASSGTDVAGEPHNNKPSNESGETNP
ncbi:MAG: hypothetical protein JWM82_2654 [Myxococcales bacterium]|nr:hypothetical protein [Myxococcales bacterium]